GCKPAEAANQPRQHHQSERNTVDQPAAPRGRLPQTPPIATRRGRSGRPDGQVDPPVTGLIENPLRHDRPRPELGEQEANVPCTRVSPPYAEPETDAQNDQACPHARIE